jgi:hypothetical protein
VKLKEMKRKPTKAGVAALSFDKDISLPSLADNVIHLPSGEENDFFCLKKGKQFLFVQEGMLDNSYWFGGTDESPFVVEITGYAFHAFETGGEKGFYDFLKPEIIKKLEKKFKVKAKRQGDIWAFPLPFITWECLELLRMLDLECYTFENEKSVGVLETRHTIEGNYMDLEVSENEVSGGNYRVFAQGTLKSPNHAPLELETLHLLAQTNGLADSGGD